MAAVSTQLTPGRRAPSARSARVLRSHPKPSRRRPPPRSRQPAVVIPAVRRCRGARREGGHGRSLGRGREAGVSRGLRPRCSATAAAPPPPTSWSTVELHQRGRIDVDGDEVVRGSIGELMDAAAVEADHGTVRRHALLGVLHDGPRTRRRAAGRVERAGGELAGVHADRVQRSGVDRGWSTPDRDASTARAARRRACGTPDCGRRRPWRRRSGGRRARRRDTGGRRAA